MNETDHLPAEDAEEPRPWEAAGGVRRDCAPHRGNLLLWLGTAGLICGLLSFVVCIAGVFGVLVGIHLVDLAEQDLRAMEAGLMDPSGRDQTNRAKIYGDLAIWVSAIGLLVGTVLLGAILRFPPFSS